MFDRRELIKVGAGAAAACLAPALPLAATEAVSLRQLGREKGIEIGSAFHGSGSQKYLDILRTHCEVLAPEWQLKPAYLRPTEASAYDFHMSDSIMRFCRENGQKFHGHTLFWHQQPIRWAESKNFEIVTQKYGGFIRDVVLHYPDSASWDVFNEIVEEKTKFRNEFLIRTFGTKFIDYCFRLVNELAPAAKLVINDYNLECAGDWCGSKQNNMLALISSLRKLGTPVHVVGIQAHLSSRYKPSPKKTLSFIRRVADLGCDVYLSEMDVNDVLLPDDIARRDAEVAKYYESFLTTVLSHKAVKRVCFWGISDSSNWVVRGQAGDTRKRGKPRAALFDDKDDAKPAFDAVVRALKTAPARA